MAPEILIVGDEDRRGSLVTRVRGRGYATRACTARELNRWIHAERLPAAIVMRLHEPGIAVVMAGLRRTRQGAGIPVVLAGTLGGELRDLADVLDLGADHFLDDSATDDEWGRALLDLVGPAAVGAATERETSAAPSRAGHAKDGTDGWRVRTEVIDETTRPDGRVAAPAPSSPSGEIGALHRTLDLLDARLGRRDAGENEEDFVDLGPEPPEFLDESDFAGSSGTHRTLTGLRPAAPPAPEGPPADPGPVTGDVPRRAGPALPLAQRGALAECPVPQLLVRLARARYSGELGLVRGRVRKDLWLVDGRVVFARSNLSQDRLLDGLLRRGRLTRQQYETARRLASKEPRRAGEILVEAGFLKGSELHELLRDHLSSVAHSVISWGEGTYRLVAGVTCDEPIQLQVSTGRLLLEGARRRFEPRQLLETLGPRASPRRAGMAVGVLDDLGVEPDDLEWVEGLDGRRTLEDAVSLVEGGRTRLPALVWVLELLGAVELTREAVRKDARAAAEIDAERLAERAALAREGDYYAVLGLGREATTAEVREAVFGLRATFSDLALDEHTRRTAAEDLRLLRAVLAEAEEILGDDALRCAYLAHLEEP